jgi:hypothetical protein
MVGSGIMESCFTGGERVQTCIFKGVVSEVYPGNWWQQLADGVVISNWIVEGEVEFNRVKPLAVASEVVRSETLHLKEKTFNVKRRGG